jgi:rod shape determining protein RodA
MWDANYLKRLDFRTVPIVLALMVVSLLVISANTMPINSVDWSVSPFVKNQIRAFAIGTVAYLFIAATDYRKLREFTWFFYLGMIVLLLGLFFVAPIHNVRRWYRFPLIPFDVQPSEYAKLVVVLALSWYLEKRSNKSQSLSTVIGAGLIVLIPFLLILKQPDLGTALVLCPITLVMFYFGNVNRKVIWFMTFLGLSALLFVLLIFLGILSHEEMRGVFTTVMKEYQYERLNPGSYHGLAGQTAIALGRFFGSGYGKSEFTSHQWLPYAFTDSVFPAFTEEFGMIGAFLLLLLFFGLIYFSFQVTAVARDEFGRLLSAGVTVYLAIHVIINVGMMCGFLPITGVPLILISYGGSSVLSTMIALGILQSVYTRRFTF